jgi:tocopherol O-methyltransferase
MENRMTDTPDLREAIREHYDQLSFFYRAFWGDHIHHGYWEADESPKDAQEKLIARLAARAGIPRGARVLDIGSGLGGSSLWLARNLDCSVLGITISPTQAAVAAERAREEGLEDRCEFAVLDANHLHLAAESFDAVWCIECSEHLEDKPAFFANCARVLRPGGRLALCVWLFGEGPGADAEQVAAVCHGMLCPSLGSRSEHVSWIQDAGFEAVEAEDITRRVEKTWELCEAILQSPPVQELLPTVDGRTRDFLNTFGPMRRAYATGAMSYGMITARKRSSQ